MSTLFTTPGCPKCKFAGQLLDKAGIEYEISQDIQAAQSHGIYSAPSLLMEQKVYTFPEIVAMCQGGYANA